MGQAMQVFSVPCWWVSWRLWRAGCISQDTYLLYIIPWDHIIQMQCNFIIPWDHLLLHLLLAPQGEELAWESPQGFPEQRAFIDCWSGGQYWYWGCFYRTRVRSLVMLVTNSLPPSLLFSKLDWCDPGVWRCPLQARGCYCCCCWWWGLCCQQFVADLEAEVWS